MINLKKISAVIASTLMLGMSAGVAAAASYPAPFVVTGGVADVAIVYGTGAGVSALDAVQAGNIQTNLQSFMGAGSTSTTTTVSGEAIELYTGGTKLYINDPINKVKTVLTKSELKTILADGSFSGNIDTTYSQAIQIGTSPTVAFGKQPTTDDDPTLAINLTTSTSSPIYNLTVTFIKAVNLSHADSEGEELTFFGQKFIVGAATDGDTLVLLKSAERIDLDSDNPSAEVTIAGKTYTVELVSASDTTATIKVTDSTGKSETKEITEAQSKKVNGLTIAVNTADETNLKLSAGIIAGSEKVTLEDNSQVTLGDEDTAVDGTDVDFHAGSPGAGLSKLTISIASDDSDKDAILAGGSFIDPVFKTTKLSLSGFNIGQNDTASREDIKIAPDGDDRMQITFTDYNGNTKTVQYSKFLGAGDQNRSLIVDDSYRNLSVMEKEILHKGDYVVIGNEDTGRLLKISNVNNVTTGYGNDKVTFQDVFAGTSTDVTWTNYGVGTVTIGGRSYDVTLAGENGITDYLYNITIDDPAESTATQMIIYPTIETSKGAKVAFYEPIVNVSVFNWTTHGVAAAALNNLTAFLVPDGDGFANIGLYVDNLGNLTATCGTGGTATVLSGAQGETKSSALATSSVKCTLPNTGIKYNITWNNFTNYTSVYLLDAAGTTNIVNPAILVIEEKDDDSTYNALIAETSLGANSDNGAGVSDIERTWGTDNTAWEATLASNSKKQLDVDLYGTFVTTDLGDSDQYSATISYPDEQVYAMAYVAEEAANIETSSSSSSASQLGAVMIKDTEVSSTSAKNLLIVGGSCINSAAATVLGSAACGSDFTTLTGVGAGQFLIQGFSNVMGGKFALLVAGYEADDTVNAATYLRTTTVDTSKKYKGTSATSATEVALA